MPGTFILKPVEANISDHADIRVRLTTVDPYCHVKVGDQQYRTHASKKFGMHPHWNDEVIIPNSSESSGQVVIKDKNNDIKIGQVDFSLEDVKSKGKVTQWYDIKKDNKVQGQLLMNMVYTPQTHGSAHANHSNKSNTTGSKNSIWGNPERYQRHSDLESKKFMMANGMSNPNLAELGTNENIGHTGHCDFHHHNLVGRDNLGPNGEVDLKYTNDITLKNLKINDGNSANTGMSNPNTAKLGINHNKGGPSKVSNPYEENYVVMKHDEPKHGVLKNPNSKHHANKNVSFAVKAPEYHLSNPNTLGLGDERLKGLRKVSFNDAPKSITNHHGSDRRPHRKSEDLGFKGTEMSNPNNARLHVNHNIGHTGKRTNFHENIAVKEQLGPI